MLLLRPSYWRQVEVGVISRYVSRGGLRGDSVEDVEERWEKAEEEWWRRDDSLTLGRERVGWSCKWCVWSYWVRVLEFEYPERLWRK
jgi:hypothetical protein